MEEETLKELIKEMELRAVSFEYNRDLILNAAINNVLNRLPDVQLSNQF